jgi:hypothetical protein
VVGVGECGFLGPHLLGLSSCSFYLDLLLLLMEHAVAGLTLSWEVQLPRALARVPPLMNGTFREGEHLGK